MRLWREERGTLGVQWATEACRLWQRVWPDANEAPLEERVDGLVKGTFVTAPREAGSEVFHLLEVDGRLVALALSYIREMDLERLDDRVPVLALAGVCCDPESRRKGYASRVVKDVFSRVEGRVPWCLFQTGVPKFYEGLGAFSVDNTFVNSLSPEDAEANPWWDETVMVYGRERKWPDGRVDLLGAAY